MVAIPPINRRRGLRVDARTTADISSLLSHEAPATIDPGDAACPASAPKTFQPDCRLRPPLCHPAKPHRPNRDAAQFPCGTHAIYA